MYENEQEDMFCVTLNNMTPKDVKLYCKTYGLCYRPSDHKGYDLAGNIDDVRNMLEDYIGKYSEIGKIMDEGIYVSDWDRSKFRCLDSKKTVKDSDDAKECINWLNQQLSEMPSDVDSDSVNYDEYVDTIKNDICEYFNGKFNESLTDILNKLVKEKRSIYAIINTLKSVCKKHIKQNVKDSTESYPMANPKEVKDIIRSVRHDIENHSDEGYTKDDIYYCIGMELSARDLRCTPHLFLPDHIGPQDQEWKDMVQGYLDNGGREQNIADSKKKIRDASKNLSQITVKNIPIGTIIIDTKTGEEWVFIGETFSNSNYSNIKIKNPKTNIIRKLSLFEHSGGVRDRARYVLKDSKKIRDAVYVDYNDNGGPFKTLEDLEQHAYDYNLEVKVIYPDYISMYCDQWVIKGDRKDIEAFIDRYYNKDQKEYITDSKKIKDSDPWHENAHYELTYADGSKENDTIPIYVKRDMSDEEIIEYFQDYHPEDKIVSVKQIGWSRMRDKKVKDSYEEVPEENKEALREYLQWYGIIGYDEDIIEVFESQEAFVDDELIEYDDSWDALDAYLTWEGILGQTEKIYDLLVNGYESPFYDDMLRDKASYDED